MSLNRAFRRLLIGSATGIAVFAVIPVAKAVFQVLTAVGEITSIAPGSQLETVLSTGDPFVVMAMYDDALLTGVGDEEIVLDPNVNPRHSLDFIIGDPLLFTFDETDDVDFGSGGYPRIEFIDGVFAGFDFEVVQDIIGVRYWRKGVSP